MPVKEILLLFSKEKIIEVFRRPELYPQQVAVLVGMFVLLVFIILITLGLIFVKPPKKEVKERPLEVVKPLKNTLIGLGITIILFIIAVGATFTYTSQPSFCKSCHIMGRDYKTWQVSSHKKVPCLACHQKPGIIGLFIEKIRMSRRAISYYSGPPKILIYSQIDNASCLQCHHQIKTETFTSHRIRVSHKEFLGVGYKCINCHPDLAHRKKEQLTTYYSGMAQCVLCHDGKRASNDCDLCHTSEGKKTIKASIADYPKVHLPEPATCRGCHSIEKCINCHKIELPHSKKWREEGGHAMDGFVNKIICWQCHTIVDDCKKCHPMMPHPHPDDWPKTHGPASQLPTPSCPGCHNKEKFCGICH